MAAGSEVLLVGERDLLATIASPVRGPATLPRALGADPTRTARRALALAPGLIVIFGPQPGELEAIRQTGAEVVEWPHEWFPVADELFTDEPAQPEPSRVFFSGPASERRDAFLQPAKHRFDVLHLAGGADLGELVDLMARCATAIDLVPEPGLADVDRIGPAMAAGMLVLAQDPAPGTGLADWQQLIGFSTPDELSLVIGDVLRDPEPFSEVRRRGRAAAEAWRASVVLPQFLEGTLR